MRRLSAPMEETMGPKDLMDYDRRRHRLEYDPAGAALFTKMWEEFVGLLSKMAAYISRIF